MLKSSQITLRLARDCHQDCNQFTDLAVQGFHSHPGDPAIFAQEFALQEADESGSISKLFWEAHILGPFSFSAFQLLVPRKQSIP
jgi:hypothetical protein